jgi:TetR/AcrR family tetracycline transcriptional repressor
MGGQGTGATAAEPTRLSRDVIVDAYLRIADGRRVGDVSLRRLGSELGVDPTAVYRHFRDKAEIVVAASDRLIEDATEGIEPTGSWRDDLRAILLAIRRAYVTHPAPLLALQASPGPMPAASRISNRMVGLLRDSGLDLEEAALAYETLESYTIGISLLDGVANEESLEGWRRAYSAEPPETHPHLTSVASLLYREPEAAFALGLDLMLDALERRVDGHRVEMRGA